MTRLQLEIGGGPHPAHPEYEQFDAIDWRERTGLSYTLGDAHHLPYPDGTFTDVYSCNLLEHFPADETSALLTEWARVLVPGGQLEVIVPDSIGILRDFFEGRNDWDHCAVRLLGGRDYEGNEHKQAFCFWEFPEVIAQVPTLEPVACTSSHAGGGIRSVSRKR